MDHTLSHQSAQAEYTKPPYLPILPLKRRAHLCTGCCSPIVRQPDRSLSPNKACYPGFQLPTGLSDCALVRSGNSGSSFNPTSAEENIGFFHGGMEGDGILEGKSLNVTSSIKLSMVTDPLMWASGNYCSSGTPRSPLPPVTVGDIEDTAPITDCNSAGNSIGEEMALESWKASLLIISEAAALTWRNSRRKSWPGLCDCTQKQKPISEAEPSLLPFCNSSPPSCQLFHSFPGAAGHRHTLLKPSGETGGGILRAWFEPSTKGPQTLTSLCLYPGGTPASAA
ncbi:PREDICTED: uncharacterized protein LOC107184774 [Myotis davidii]|uniref:uncharacterized protein LOC107184774 n=1 Tax=Myotis davidii TaxID=225400 RepID=UPI0007676A77|nr:PREDICTED: uncharacterized protein LOC107184774 [Myotis davidii]